MLLSTQVALGVTAVASLVFVVAYALRSPWMGTTLGRHLMAIAFLFAVDATTLLLLSAGVLLQLWVYNLIYWFGALLAVQRVVIYFQVLQQHRDTPRPYDMRDVLSGMKTPQIFGREPALWIAAIAAILTVLPGFGFPGLDDGVIASVDAFLVAAAATWTALLTKPPAPTVFVGIIGAAATLAAAFGYDLPQQTVAGISGASIAVMMLITRHQVTPVSDPRGGV